MSVAKSQQFYFESERMIPNLLLHLFIVNYLPVDLHYFAILEALVVLVLLEQ